MEFAIVTPSEAKQNPYPYVYVNRDGSVRELHPAERDYLETPFLIGDSGRPYVKQAYLDKDGWGEIKGFCPRYVIPKELSIAEAPANDPGS